MAIEQAATRAADRGLPLVSAAALSAALCVLVLVSSLPVETRLGAPTWWAWVLTGLQVLALWSAGRRRAGGWLLGAGVQPGWITYAVLTGQYGFIPGCAVSGGVQLNNFLVTRDGEV
jgi:hypothetical protein